MSRLFALDQNFPQRIISSLAPYMPEAKLVSIREIHPRMPLIDDWAGRPPRCTTTTPSGTG